jgi:hypothetical protein
MASPLAANAPQLQFPAATSMALPLPAAHNSNDATAILGQATETILFTNLHGQKRVNQLGGTVSSYYSLDHFIQPFQYTNGRPLPDETRLAIVELAKAGVKPVKISRQLQVSHGAVSKILNRFHETGSVQPGQIGGPNPRRRVAIQTVRGHIQRLRANNPRVTAGEIRRRLIDGFFYFFLSRKLTF